MRTELLAFAAAVLAVAAAWDASGVLGSLAARARALVGPIVDGHAPDRGEERRLVATCSLVALAAGWLLAAAQIGIVLATVAGLAARRGLAIARERRRDRLVAAAPAVARAIADALAGGHSILAAVAGAHRSVTGPARRELARLEHLLALGKRTDDALEGLRLAADHPSYDALTAAVMLQREAGGDLASLLRRLAATLETQARADAEARSATVQARFGAAVVVGLPAAAAALAELVAPGSVAGLLSTPASAAAVAGSLVLQALAWLLIRRIARTVS